MTISTLDDRTLDLLLAGELETADAPAGYARVATLIAVASSPSAPAEQEMPPGLLELMLGSPSLVTSFRLTPSAGRSRRLRTRAAMVGARSEGRCAGHACVRSCRCRWVPNNSNNNLDTANTPHSK